MKIEYSSVPIQTVLAYLILLKTNNRKIQINNPQKQISELYRITSFFFKQSLTDKEKIFNEIEASDEINAIFPFLTFGGALSNREFFFIFQSLIAVIQQTSLAWRDFQSTCGILVTLTAAPIQSFPVLSPPISSLSFVFISSVSWRLAARRSAVLSAA